MLNTLNKKILTPEEKEEKEKIGRAKTKLWRAGVLKFKLKGIQNEMKDYLTHNPSDVSVILASRRVGKSYCLQCYAIEEAIKNPGSIIKYAAPTQNLVVKNLNPAFKQIIEDCPSDIKPNWVESLKSWVFPNGSAIQVAGVDNNRADSLRGGASILAIVDEAAFVDDLEYVIYSVLGPTLDTTNGRLVMASTPNPKQPQHDFHTKFVIPRLSTGELKKYTIYDSPMLDAKGIQRVIDRYPQGIEDPAFRCEYLCEISATYDSMVIPEFNDEVRKDIIRESEMPVFYDAYVAGDPAVVDLTGIVFAYYDFIRSKIVIVDELVLGGEGFTDITTDDIASGIKRKESMYFINPITKERISPYLRIMDNNNKILINDLYKEHGLLFTPTAKDDKEAQINKLRMMIKRGQVEINPRCKNLIFHLGSAQWRVNRDGVKVEFQRVKGQGDLRAHHCDLVDALIYLVRNVDVSKNPYPNEYFNKREGDWYIPQADKKAGVGGLLRSIMNMKK